MEADLAAAFVVPFGEALRDLAAVAPPRLAAAFFFATFVAPMDVLLANAFSNWLDGRSHGWRVPQHFNAFDDDPSDPGRSSLVISFCPTNGPDNGSAAIL